MLGDFEGLDVTGSDDVYIKQGEIQEVKVLGHSNIIDTVELKIKDGIWKVKLKKGNYSDYKLKYYITLPSITSLQLSGAANVFLSDFNASKNIKITLLSSGNIQMNSMNGIDDLKVEISGSGSIKANAEYSLIKLLNVKITGSGNFKGGSLKAENCIIKISGSGNATVEVIQKLNATISGSGNIYCKGQPEIEKQITGAGIVKEED